VHGNEGCCWWRDLVCIRRRFLQDQLWWEFYVLSIDVLWDILYSS
jgi:hypothetical protein